MPQHVTDELQRLRERVAELERRNGALEARAADTTPPAATDVPAFFRVNWHLHKWAGLVTIVFLLVMGVSGIFLTHANTLGLQPIMLRLHTGMLLGPFARLYCDVAGVSLIVLMVSGVVLYLYPGAVKRNAAT